MTQDGPARHDRLSQWVVPFLGAVTFLTAIGNVGLVSIMPAIGRTLHIPDYLVASIFSLSALTWAVSSPFWVAHVHRHGANRFVRAGLIGFILSMGGCALSVELGLIGWLAPFATFLLFFVLRSVYGLLGSAAATATQALIALRTEGAERTRTLTTLAGALSLGTIIGPAIAPLLIFDPVGPIGPMLGFALIGLVTFAASFVFLPREAKEGGFAASTDPNRRSYSMIEVWREAAIGRHLTFGLLLCSAQAINLYTIGFVVIDRTPGDPMAAQAMVGVTMTGGAVAALIAQWGLVRWLALTPATMMTAGVACALIGNLTPIASDAQIAAVIGFVIASFGYGLSRPGFSAAASLGGESEHQVAIASAVTLIAGASITLPPIIAAAAYQLWAPAPFAIAALLGAYLLLREAMRAGSRTRIVHMKR
ncbi:MFS transporter [Sphingosinithalassobacter portus]|uniref:MFS transporter n=1 Tax=Stakelama portus TaxID=2676234 RepID=UPI00137A37F2|nr:MFS transporter [Sphingosinithalassobacter portus]